MPCPECGQDPCVCSLVHRLVGERPGTGDWEWLLLLLAGYAGYRVIKGATKKAEER